MTAGDSPILTAHLFAPLHAELLALLRGLNAEQWQQPTSAGAWRVQDVAAHLLDGDLRRIAIDRDGYAAKPDVPIRDYHDLVRHLDALNDVWVRAARRISPALLVELLATTGPAIVALMSSADPHAPATFPVAWAGQDASPMWLDIGREFTERWHHQDQIRDAVGAEALADAQWLAPVIALSLLALPRSYAALERETGTALVLEVSGAAGGEWSVAREADGWHVRTGRAPQADCTVAIADLALARLLLHRYGADTRAAGVRVTGDAALAAPLLAARAVMV